MKKLLAMMVALPLAVTAAPAQEGVRVFTRPAVPPREALDRLQLKLGWRAYVPTGGTRDGIFSLQLASREVFVQTYSGMVIALDRETGQTLWRASGGYPYDTAQPLGWNLRTVFAARGTWLFALDRQTGAMQWRFALPDAAAAAPAADDEQLYLALPGGRFSVFKLPDISRQNVHLGGVRANKNYLPLPEVSTERPPSLYAHADRGSLGPLSSARDGARLQESSQQPLHLWGSRAGASVEQPPLLTLVDLFWAGTDGITLSLPKRTEVPRQPYRFSTDAAIAVQPGQHNEIAYVGAHDGSLHALHIASGRALWRFASGNPIMQKPAVTNEDVFVAPHGSGLYRLERTTGQTVWRNPTAQRFLAVNPKFVYAADRSGRLMVLDRARGTTLSTYDGTRDFNVPVANEQTDRIFLAAHDGLIVCLHDRDYEAPVVNKEDLEKWLNTPPEKPSLGPPAGKPDPKMPEKPDNRMPEKPDNKMPAKPDNKMPEKP